MSDAHITPDRYIDTNRKLKKSLAGEFKNEQKAKAMENDAEIFQSEQLDKLADLVLLICDKVDKRKTLLKDYNILKPAYESITKKRKQGEEELPGMWWPLLFITILLTLHESLDKGNHFLKHR